jgi:hypothetical protein
MHKGNYFLHLSYYNLKKNPSKDVNFDKKTTNKEYAIKRVLLKINDRKISIKTLLLLITIKKM